MYRHSLAVTELKQFEGRGHSLTIDHGWRDVAETVLGWLSEMRLKATATPTSSSVPEASESGAADDRSSFVRTKSRLHVVGAQVRRGHA